MFMPVLRSYKLLEIERRELGSVFRRWYPDFSVEEDEVQAA